MRHLSRVRPISSPSERGRIYVQVAETMLDQGTYERGLAPFGLVCDSFPKMVLMADRFRLGATEQGAQIASIIDWLLGRCS